MERFYRFTKNFNSLAYIKENTMPNVKVKIEAKLVELIQKALKRHKWLGLNSVEEFVDDAIRVRVELLLLLR